LDDQPRADDDDHRLGDVADQSGPPGEPRHPAQGIGVRITVAGVLMTQRSAPFGLTAIGLHRADAAHGLDEVDDDLRDRCPRPPVGAALRRVRGPVMKNSGTNPAKTTMASGTSRTMRVT